MSNIVSTFENHFEVSYGSAKAAFRQKPEDKWNFSIGRNERPTVEFRAELMLAAAQINEAFQRAPLLYVDGSFASQVMVQAFRWSKFKFHCVVPKFQKDYNVAAVSQSILFLESIEASYEVIDVDLEGLLNDPQTLKWTQKYTTDLPHQLVAMKVWKQLAQRQLPLVFPMGLPLFKKTTEGWKVMEFEKEYGLHQFQKDHKFMGVPSFFKWSSEMVMSLMEDPILRSLMTNVRKESALSDRILKEVFGNYFPIFGERSWTGFEKAEFILKKFHQASKESFPGALTAFAFPYADYCGRLAFRIDAVDEAPKPYLRNPKAAKPA